ncbi:enoyl-CoA hydratase-related protein [Salipiger abyssi]|uniref:enoyl-CoA hydratase-related protein n=1 Tax=Salipiger abyssi TaxID=1250539 RepID=UPI001A8FF729|nr:enoyl-CoA hydratase-related protein [Salipiger abyssi]MBN9887160.1 enoyl-CoA hydratase/isomerase family protein [Salipiger abyssi]
MPVSDSPGPLVALAPSEADPRIGVITLNRPERRNAFNTEMADAFAAAVEAFENDDALRVAILRGNGPVFCAGMDLGAFSEGERPGLDTADGFAHFVRRPRRKPMIAEVQAGGAFAGGFEIVLACDLAVAATGARFSVPEVMRGIVAAGGGAVRLPLRIPAAIAREMLFTGNPITAERAFDLGLLNAVVAPEEVSATALGLAAQIAGNAPLAVSETKSVIDDALSAGEAVAWHTNRRAWDRVVSSEDALEGATAFKERRPPEWRGR